MQAERAAARYSYDYYLILATVVVLFVISAISIYAMFYFKWAEVQHMAPAVKAAYMDRMNAVMAPFAVALIVLLGICIPKRLLPVEWLNRSAVLLIGVAGLVSVWQGVKTGLLVVLGVSLLLQLVVLVLAIGGSRHLRFTHSGYWLRLGSSLMHLGLVLVLLDLVFYRFQTIHLLLFWITTLATVAGMASCFWSGTVLEMLKTSRITGRCKT